jgi:hypothetical protein
MNSTPTPTSLSSSSQRLRPICGGWVNAHQLLGDTLGQRTRKLVHPVCEVRRSTVGSSTDSSGCAGTSRDPPVAQVRLGAERNAWCIASNTFTTRHTYRVVPGRAPRPPVGTLRGWDQPQPPRRLDRGPLGRRAHCPRTASTSTSEPAGQGPSYAPPYTHVPAGTWRTVHTRADRDPHRGRGRQAAACRPENRLRSRPTWRTPTSPVGPTPTLRAGSRATVAPTS